MSKKELYRIKEGIVEAEEYSMPFFFGIVYSNNGVITVELYINAEYNLEELLVGKNQRYWNLDYTLKGKTEENNIIIIDELDFTQNYPDFSRIKMRSYGKMEHIKTKEMSYERYNFKPLIYYLQLEGLRIEFTDVTENIKSRGGSKLETFDNWKRDHSTASLCHKKRLYPHTYFQAKESDEIIVQFSNNVHESLNYELFSELKSDFVNTLSFLNGAEVKIRKECFGEYYSVDKVDAEKVITYSFWNLNNQKHNSYIPINSIFHRSEHVLSKFLLNNFDSFKEWNEKLDLKSIVFYLNNSQQAKSIQEKVFIQIIAFERLTTMYVEYLGEKEEFLPKKEEFQEIKKELLKIIESYKESFGNGYDTVKSKIGNLNQIKRHSTTDKMYRLINDFNITVTPQIEDLINEVRHKTVHRGDIGKGKQAVVTFHLLDELIREILLRMANYTGGRKSLVLLKK